MLRHSEITADTVQLPVASPAVAPEVLNAPFTSQEIADAIAAVEKERRDQAAREAETTQIARVLDQLGLDMPAQAVAERVRENRSRLMGQKVVRKRSRALMASVWAALLLGVLVIGFGVLSAVRAGEVKLPALQSAKLPVVDPGTLLVTNRSGKLPVVQTFAEVADGVPVTISADDLQLLLRDSLPDGLRDEVSASFDPRCEWTVLRENGEYYLRGYRSSRITPAALLASPAIRMYNEREITTMRGPQTQNIALTLPIRAFRVRQSQSLDFPEPYHVLDVKVNSVDKAVFGK